MSFYVVGMSDEGTSKRPPQEELASPWRRETVARLALGGGIIFVGGWAYMALELARSAGPGSQAELHTGLDPSAIGRGVLTFPRLLLLRDGRGDVLALDRRCTHLGCLVSPSADGRLLRCPCHGSEFDRSGGVRRGPATRPLRRLRTSLDSRGELVVHVKG